MPNLGCRRFIACQKRLLLPMFALLLLFCLTRALILATVCSSFFRVFIDARFERPEVVQVYYGTRQGFVEKRSKKTITYTAGQRETHPVDINNQPARQLRIDMGDSPGVSRLYGLRLTSFFFPDRTFSAAQIARDFTPGPGVAMQLCHDYVEIFSASADPSLRLNIKGGLRHQGLFYGWILPFIFSCAAYLVLSSPKITGMAAFTDVRGGKLSSGGLHFAALDGLRGLAALFVLAEHVGIMSGGIGALGVDLFFALSGFLLAIPFAREPERALSWSSMLGYIRRRLLRIIPMYYTMITILFLFPAKHPEFFRHYLFLQGDGYLWTVPQEMFFYLLLPLVAVILCLVMRIRAWLALPALLGLIFLGSWALGLKLIKLYGLGQNMPPFIDIFLWGMFFSYCYQYIRARSLWRDTACTWCSRVLGLGGWAGIALLLMLAARSLPGFPNLDIRLDTGYHLAGFLAALTIFCAAAAERSFFAACMRLLPLRAVGVVGYSFYLVHPTFIHLCREIALYYGEITLNPLASFAVVAVVTYCASALTYSYIERPFMK